jgi:hypothetical protein
METTETEVTMAHAEQLIDGVVAAELDDDLDDGLEIVVDDHVTEADACPPEDAPEGILAAAEGPLSAGAMVRISKLRGVPLFFARGVPPRPQTFSVEPGFLKVLELTVDTVRKRAPESFGDLKRITCAGILVAKPGFHGLGRAFDHDAWAFEHVNIRPIAGDHAAPSLAKRQRYWALGACMRARSAFVLHGHFPGHGDHFHQDNGGPRPFTTGSDATVKLVQAVCRHIYGKPIAIDGAFGPKSKAAVKAAMQSVGLAGDVFDEKQFRRFLLRSGRLGFELSTRA